MAADDVVDMNVVICASYPGSFRHGINFSVELCKRLEKVADALALQVRQGAASEDATSALFETVVGYVPSGKGAMLLCLSDRGLTGGLQNVRGLLQQALQVARQNPAAHSHSHGNTMYFVNVISYPTLINVFLWSQFLYLLVVAKR